MKAKKISFHSYATNQFSNEKLCTLPHFHSEVRFHLRLLYLVPRFSLSPVP